MDLDYCLHTNQVPLILEMDSLFAQQVLDGNLEGPWFISWDFRYINSRMIIKEVEICHTFMYGNSLADSFFLLIVLLILTYK